jgi:hypothetical protein
VYSYPAAQVTVWANTPWGGRNVVRASIPLAAGGSQNVALFVRPVRTNGPGWGCDGAGAWVGTAAYAASRVPTMPDGLWFTTLPVAVSTNTTAQQLRMNPASGATLYRFFAQKIAFNGTATNAAIFSGSISTVSATPVVNVNFATGGRYRVVVTPEGLCGIGNPSTHEFTVGGIATAPIIDPNAPYELGLAEFDCNAHTGKTWITYPPLNPAWAYTATITTYSNAFRPFSFRSLGPNSTHTRYEFEMVAALQDPRPIAGQYFINLTVNSGVGQPRTQVYVVEDALCRPVRGGGGSPDPTVATVPIAAERVTVYPNPVTENELTVQAATGHCHWARLYDQYGALVREQTASEKPAQLVLSVAQLPAGLYVLRTFDGEQVTTTRVSRK